MRILFSTLTSDEKAEHKRLYNLEYKAKHKARLAADRSAWRKENNEQASAYGKKMYQNNIEHIREWQRTRVQCVCGSSYALSNKTQHENSMKHKKCIAE